MAKRPEYVENLLHRASFKDIHLIVESYYTEYIGVYSYAIDTKEVFEAYVHGWANGSLWGVGRRPKS